MFKNFKADLKRHVACSNDKENIYLLFEQGVWAIAVYRLGRWMRKVRIPIVSFILKVVSFLLFKIVEIVTGISLPISAEIGRGFYIGHFGPIILHSNTKIGKNCSIGTGVIVGTRGQGSTGAPKIGNNVYMGTGSKILGSITIGNNVTIGANAVVIKNVPAGATVAGIPAKVIKRKGR